LYLNCICAVAIEITGRLTHARCARILPSKSVAVTPLWGGGIRTHRRRQKNDSVTPLWGGTVRKQEFTKEGKGTTVSRLSGMVLSEDKNSAEKAKDDSVTPLWGGASRRFSQTLTILSQQLSWKTGQ